MDIEKNKGITITSLIITVVILLILSTVTIKISKDLIDKAKIENLKTNMLLLQAEAKSAAEDFNFKEYTLNDEAEDYQTQLDNLKDTLIGNKIEDEAIREKVTATLRNTGVTEEDLAGSIENCYYLTQSDLLNINIDADVKNGEYYVIKYDFANIKAEIYYTNGYKYENRTYYSLTQLEEMNQ